MKVTREPQGFVPIIITLENEEEAQFLWELLNCPSEGIKHLLETNDYELSSPLDRDLFEKLNIVYRPDDC